MLRDHFSSFEAAYLCVMDFPSLSMMSGRMGVLIRKLC